LGKQVFVVACKECVTNISLLELDSAWMFVKLDETQTPKGNEAEICALN
jgi:hypothetical protein